MNETIDKYLLTGDKLMSETHLRQSWFIYSACGPFTRNREQLQKIKETADSKYICKSQLEKPYFQQDTSYKDLKDLSRRTIAYKTLRNKAFNVAKI